MRSLIVRQPQQPVQAQQPVYAQPVQPQADENNSQNGTF